MTIMTEQSINFQELEGRMRAAAADCRTNALAAATDID
jgi:hypothetical protein